MRAASEAAAGWEPAPRFLQNSRLYARSRLFKPAGACPTSLIRIVDI